MKLIRRLFTKASSSLVGIALVAGLALLRPSSGSAETRAILTLPASVQCGSIKCTECQASGSHFTSADGSGGGNLHADCWAIMSCQSAHGCGFTGEGDAAARPSTAEVWKAFVVTSPGRLPEFLKLHARDARLDPTRTAMQILDCQGRVFAHVPLTEAQLEALAD